MFDSSSSVIPGNPLKGHFPVIPGTDNILQYMFTIHVLLLNPFGIVYKNS